MLRLPQSVIPEMLLDVSMWQGTTACMTKFAAVNHSAAVTGLVQFPGTCWREASLTQTQRHLMFALVNTNLSKGMSRALHTFPFTD